MTETHLHVVDTDESDIPQANGNPKPGKSDYSEDHSPAVQEYTYEIEWTWDPGTTLVIAAHALCRRKLASTLFNAYLLTRKRPPGPMVRTSRAGIGQRTSNTKTRREDTDNGNTMKDRPQVYPSLSFFSPT